MLRQPTLQPLNIHEQQERTPLQSMLAGDHSLVGESFVAPDPRYNWRGFSFGQFWFSYYFTIPEPSSLTGGRPTV